MKNVVTLAITTNGPVLRSSGVKSIEDACNQMRAEIEYASRNIIGYQIIAADGMTGVMSFFYTKNGDPITTQSFHGFS